MELQSTKSTCWDNFYELSNLQCACRDKCVHSFFNLLNLQVSHSTDLYSLRHLTPQIQQQSSSSLLKIQKVSRWSMTDSLKLMGTEVTPGPCKADHTQLSADETQTAITEHQVQKQVWSRQQAGHTAQDESATAVCCATKKLLPSQQERTVQTLSLKASASSGRPLSTLAE